MALIGLSQVVGIVKEPLRAYSFEVELPRDFGDAERLRYQEEHTSELQSR